MTRGKPASHTPARSSAWLLVTALLLVVITGAAVRAQRLHNSPPDKVLVDVLGYIAGAQKVSWQSPFAGRYSTGPMVMWVDRIAIEIGAQAGIKPRMAVKYGTALLSLGSLALFFLWTRSLIGVWGALAAGLFAAMNPLLAEMDISGGRDTPYMFWLNFFCWFAFAAQTPKKIVWGMGLTGGLMSLTRINSLLTVCVISFVVLWRNAGKRCWRAWATAFVLALAMAAPFIATQWVVTGDPLNSINSHSAWHSAVDPDSGRKVHTFAEFLLSDVGLKRLLIRTVDGAYRWLLGQEARDAFFSARNLPYHLYLIPFVMYVIGMFLAGLRQRWEPFCVLLLAAGPVWPLSQALVGLDPRLLLFTVFFIAFSIGCCTDWLLGISPVPLPEKNYYSSVWPWSLQRTGRSHE